MYTIEYLGNGQPACITTFNGNGYNLIIATHEDELNTGHIITSRWMQTPEGAQVGDRRILRTYTDLAPDIATLEGLHEQYLTTKGKELAVRATFFQPNFQ